MIHYIEYDPATGEGHEINPFKRSDLVAVVRCRDCANFDSKRDGCWWFAHAERQSDYSWADEPSDVEPDGFCAWGERREQ